MNVLQCNPTVYDVGCSIRENKADIFGRKVTLPKRNIDTRQLILAIFQGDHIHEGILFACPWRLLDTKLSIKPCLLQFHLRQRLQRHLSAWIAESHNWSKVSLFRQTGSPGTDDFAERKRLLINWFWALYRELWLSRKVWQTKIAK